MGWGLIDQDIKSLARHGRASRAGRALRQTAAAPGQPDTFELPDHDGYRLGADRRFAPIANHRGRKYTVGETKGSVWAQFSFVAGMGQQDKAAVEATRTDTAAVLDDKKEYDAARPMAKALGTSSQGYVQIRNGGERAYTRHVLFFSIPHAAAHAEALILCASGHVPKHESHAAHQLTREWGDADIDKVVDNRAGMKGEARDQRKR